jgi:hypothetical protein
MNRALKASPWITTKLVSGSKKQPMLATQMP